MKPPIKLDFRHAVILLFVVASIGMLSGVVEAQLTDPGPVGGTSAVRVPQESVPDVSRIATSWDATGIRRLLLAAADRWTEWLIIDRAAMLPGSRGYALRTRR